MGKNNGERFHATTFTMLREHVTRLSASGRAAFRTRWNSNPQEARREAKTSFVQRHFGLDQPWARHLVLISEIMQAREAIEPPQPAQPSARIESVSQPFTFPPTKIGATGDDATHDKASIAVILAELGLHAEAHRLTGSPTEPASPDVAALMAEWKRANSPLARGTHQLFSVLGMQEGQPGGRLGAFLRQLFGQSGSDTQAQEEK